MKPTPHTAPNAGRRPLPQRALAIGIAVALPLLSLRSLQAEDRAQAKYLWYAEERGRIEVSGPSLLVEKELNSWLSLRLEGVYNAVSGATPTGEPAGRRTTQVEVSETTTTTITETFARKTYQAVSGASGQGARGVAKKPATRQVTRSIATTRTETLVLADHDHLPTAELTDEREAFTLLVSARLGPGTLGASFSWSTELDYESTSGALKWTQEFNEKTTTLSAGFAFAHDEVDQFWSLGSQGKDTLDWHLGVTQVLDKFTVVELHGRISSARGYLNDQYKIALVGDDLLPEERPGSRVRGTVALDLKRYVAPLGGSLAAGYRFGSDTFGIDSHEVSLTWTQKLGAHWTLALGGRGYLQNAADFYAPRFRGAPDHYSADYRLSSLTSASGQARLTWKVRDFLSVDVGYERYEMRGRDGVTNGEAYPVANVISVGAQLWF